MIRNILIILIIFCQLFGYTFVNLSDDDLALYMLDVGQGDAILLKTADRKYALIDGGPSSDLLEQLGKSMPYWVNEIDLVIATHGDADHIVGLVDVFDRYTVNEFYYNGEEKNTLVFKSLLNASRKQDSNIKIVGSGDKFTVGCCTTFNVLWPNEKDWISDSNDRSVSILISYGDFDIFMSGDLSYSYEETLASNIHNDVEILKVGHHGSKTSTSKKFLNMLSPEIALISSGRNNKFGHPHKEVLENLRENNVKYYRTDEQGRITVKSNGSNYNVDID